MLSARRDGHEAVDEFEARHVQETGNLLMQRSRIVAEKVEAGQLAIVGLETSNGPDVHVWLSAGPVIEGLDGWFTAAGYEHIDLGLIKGNIGDQLYDIPADVDLAAFRAVDLWCEQFAVSFGAAALA